MEFNKLSESPNKFNFNENIISSRKSFKSSNSIIKSKLNKQNTIPNLTAKNSSINNVETEFLNIISNLKTNTSNNFQDLQTTPEKEFEIILQLLKKQLRNPNELKYIKQYLLKFDKFIEILKKSKQFENYYEIITRISSYITYETFEENSLLFRTGEKGDKFYIIFKGSVVILIAKEIKMKMDEQDYIKHLIKLKNLGETEILNRTLQANKNIYPIDENNLEKFLQGLNGDNRNNKGGSMTLRSAQIKEVLKYQKLFSSLISAEMSKNKIVKVEDYISSTKPTFNFFGKLGERIRASQNGVNGSQNGMGVSLYTQNCEVNLQNAQNGMGSSLNAQNGRNYSLNTFQNGIGTIQGSLNLSNTPEVTVWEYFQLLTLKSGDTFGEVALELESQKRTATVIAVEDTCLGFLSKKIYSECIREANEKVRKNNLSAIVSNQIFKGINKSTFEKKNLLNLFIIVKLNQCENLISENEMADFVYIIKEGEFHVRFKKSLNEINLLIKTLGGAVDEDLERKNFGSEISYKNFSKLKFNFRSSIISEKDVVGLDDFIFMSKYFCNVECSSNRGEAFKIEKSIFETLIKSDNNLKHNLNKYLIVKKKILLDKLINFKYIRISCHVEFKTNHKFENLTYDNNKIDNKKLNLVMPKLKINYDLSNKKLISPIKVNNNFINSKWHRNFTITNNNATNFNTLENENYNNNNFHEGGSIILNNNNITLSKFMTLEGEVSICPTHRSSRNKNLSLGENKNNCMATTNFEISNLPNNNFITVSSEVNESELIKINGNNKSHFNKNYSKLFRKIDPRVSEVNFMKKTSNINIKSNEQKIFFNKNSTYNYTSKENVNNYKKEDNYNIYNSFTNFTNNRTNRFSNYNLFSSFTHTNYQTRKIKNNLLLSQSYVLTHHNTTIRDKQILKNIIDKMVSKNSIDGEKFFTFMKNARHAGDSLNINKNSKVKLAPTTIVLHKNKNVNVIDCLVLDKVIENSEIQIFENSCMNTNSNIYKNAKNNMKTNNFLGSNTPKSSNSKYSNFKVSKINNINNSFLQKSILNEGLNDKLNSRDKGLKLITKKPKNLYSSVCSNNSNNKISENLYFNSENLNLQNNYTNIISKSKLMPRKKYKK